MAQVLPCRLKHTGRGRGSLTRLMPTTMHQGSPPRAQVQPIASASPATQAEASRTTFHHGITYTSYEVNTCAIKFNTTGVRVLIDPWFVGDLTFGGTGWLYTGQKRAVGRTLKVNLDQLASETDVLIITQGLPDHAHLPTLELFNKDIPVVCNSDAAKVIAPLKFTNVRVLEHGQTLTACDDRLKITGTVGALVGPPWSKRQLGLVLRENTERPASLYFEPHCDFDPASVRKVGPVDVVVTPVTTSELGVGPLRYGLVTGVKYTLDLLKILQPKVLLPLMNADIDEKGPATALVIHSGSPDDMRKQIADAGLKTRVEVPSSPGEALAIAL